MLRIGLAPCSPFTVSREMMRDAALLARDKGVMLHTHLAENDEDVAYSPGPVRLPPGPVCRGSRLDRSRRLARPLRETRPRRDRPLRPHRHRGRALPLLELPPRLGDRAGPRDARRRGPGRARRRWLGLERSGQPGRRGADGDAAAAGRLGRRRDERRGPRSASPPAAAPRCSAATDCGQIAPGFRGDIAVWDASDIESAGSWDPAALALAGPPAVRHLFVEGRQVVRDGRLTTLDLTRTIARQTSLARRLAG